MIQHKTTRVSYKNHKIVKVPENEWVVKENAHEPIVSQELWDKVQTVNQSVSRGKVDKNGNVHALSGLLVCADCGAKLKAKYSWDRNGKVYQFTCRTYVDLGKKYCTSHTIGERKIESIVLQDIQSMLDEVSMDEGKARERFIRNKAKSSEQNRYSDERQLKVIQNRLAALDKLIESAFEERVLGNLPESVCAKLCEKYQNERESLEKNEEEIEQRLAEADKNEEGVDEYIRRLKEYGRCESLTREMCVQLIDFITIGEKNSQTNSRDIHIYYKFISNEHLDDFRKPKK